MRSSLHTSFIVATLATACYLGSTPTPTPTPTSPTYEADGPSTYVPKVKNLLTGLPATQAEIDQVAGAQDPSSALASLVDGWMQTAEYQDVMLSFFELAFQQTQITSNDFAEIIPFGQQALGSDGYVNAIVENAKESFARTMLELVSEDRPFTDAFTTTRFMLTPPLMELYGFVDAAQADDSDLVNKVTDQVRTSDPGVSVTLEDTTPIPLADSIDPTSASYMHWYFPNMVALAEVAPVSAKNPLCAVDSRTYSIGGGNTTSANLSHVLHDLLYGTMDAWLVGAPPGCVAVGTTKNSIFKAADFGAWRMVTLHPPGDGSGAKPVRFYDVPTLENPATTDLVLSVPRVGFFSTPAFQANWQTNMSNQMRVTMNQIFIVALGAQVDGSDLTDPQNPPGVDTKHAGDPTCYGCHKTLDTSRSILSATYSYGYGAQRDASLVGQKGWFAFQGVVNPNMTSIADLGKTLAGHPLVASAWAQKLCYYATSRACAADDPAFQKIVADFQNGFSWPTLVRELFSSPLVTNATETKTWDELGEVVSLSRTDHLCATLSNRLGIPDVCALRASTPPQTGVPLLAPGLPSDGYGRGAPVPVLPTQPTLFYRAGVENICEDLANEIVDVAAPPAPGGKTYSSASQADVDAAVADFVSTVMGLGPNDPRAAQATSILASHYASALVNDPPASPTDALKSTFIVACSSPSVTGIGM